MNYDIIGDIHGHADALKVLLQDIGLPRQPRRIALSQKPLLKLPIHARHLQPAVRRVAGC